MKKQAKAKLPKVWVALDDDGVAWCATDRKYGDRAGFELHQYAPVQPPRRCVWTYVSITRTWSTECGHHDWKAENFCPYCGGKIVRRKS